MTSDEQFRSQLVAMLPRLRRFALALAGNVHDADDLVQTALVRALAQDLTALAVERLDSWMYKVIQNLWIDERRKRVVQGRKEPLDDAINVFVDDGRRIVEARSELARAQKVFDRMSPDLRTSAVLVMIDGLSYRDAADVLGVPIGTVMSRVSRARSALAAGLEEIPARPASAS